MKELEKIGKFLRKKEQKQIIGGYKQIIGSLGPSSECWAISDSTECYRAQGCNYFGCYCGPIYPHIAPC